MKKNATPKDWTVKPAESIPPTSHPNRDSKYSEFIDSFIKDGIPIVEIRTPSKPASAAVALRKAIANHALHPAIHVTTRDGAIYLSITEDVAEPKEPALLP